MARASENDVALAILQIAKAQPNKICTFNQARSNVGNYINLSANDLAMSLTRPGEPLWHQQIRNIQSHHDADGNFINSGYLMHVPDRGYKITDLGENYLKQRGL